MFESSSQYCKIIFGHLQVNSTFLIGPKILRICKRSVGQGRGDKKKYICWSQWFICQMLRLLHRAQKWIVGPGRIDKTRSLCCGHEEFSLCSIFLRWTLNLKVGLGRRDMMNLMFKAVNTFDVPRLWPRTPNFQIARGHTDMMFFFCMELNYLGMLGCLPPDPKFQCWQRHQGKSLGQTALNQHWNLGPGEPTEARAMIVHVCFKGGGGGTFFPSTVLWGRPSLLLQTRPPRTLACHHSIPCLPGSFFRTWPKNDHDLAIALSVQLLCKIVQTLFPAPTWKCSCGGMARTEQKTDVISFWLKLLTP